MEECKGTIIDEDGCELEVWIVYHDKTKTEVEHVLVVFDGKTIGDFPYKLPDGHKICQAADKIAQGHESEIDLRLKTSSQLSIDDDNYEVIEAADNDSQSPIVVPFQYGSQRLTAVYKNGIVSVLHGIIKITDDFSVNEGTSLIDILAQAALAPVVPEIQNKLAAGK